MSEDDDYITPAEVRPGMHVEIQQRPWRGVITSPLVQGTFTADRDDDPATGWVATSWSVDGIGSIRLLRDPLPTARHARIVARVYRHPYEGWRVLTRYTEDDHHGVGFEGWTRDAPWRSDVPVDGQWWHRAEHIQEWKPLAPRADSLGEVFGGAA